MKYRRKSDCASCSRCLNTGTRGSLRVQGNPIPCRGFAGTPPELTAKWLTEPQQKTEEPADLRAWWDRGPETGNDFLLPHKAHLLWEALCQIPKAVLSAFPTSGKPGPSNGLISDNCFQSGPACLCPPCPEPAPTTAPDITSTTPIWLSNRKAGHLLSPHLF